MTQATEDTVETTQALTTPSKTVQDTEDIVLNCGPSKLSGRLSTLGGRQ